MLGGTLAEIALHTHLIGDLADILDDVVVEFVHDRLLEDIPARQGEELPDVTVSEDPALSDFQDLLGDVVALESPVGIHQGAVLGQGLGDGLGDEAVHQGMVREVVDIAETVLLVGHL